MSSELIKSLEDEIKTREQSITDLRKQIQNIKDAETSKIFAEIEVRVRNLKSSGLKPIAIIAAPNLFRRFQTFFERNTNWITPPLAFYQKITSYEGLKVVENTHLTDNEYYIGV